MLKDPNNPNRFYFFETFRDEAAAQAHRGTENFKTWRRTVNDTMDGNPERIATMQTAFPSDGGLELQKPGLLNRYRNGRPSGPRRRS